MSNKVVFEVHPRIVDSGTVWNVYRTGYGGFDLVASCGKSEDAKLLAKTLQIVSDCENGDYTIDRMLQFFSYKHLPPDLQEISKRFCHLAYHVCPTIPSNPERTVALRKLLESKDCAVRAFLYKESKPK